MAADAITIERAELTDDASRTLIAALNVELSGMYPEPGANHFRLDPHDVAEGRGVFLVARRAGKSVGCGALRRRDAETAELKRMYVAPAVRGTGLGRRLLAALEAEARSMRVQRVVLETGIRQAAALALYRRSGFVPIPLFGEYVGSPDTSICLGKNLTALAEGIRRQHERLRAALAAGMPRLGWKICVNEKGSQERLGLCEPFVGYLDGTRCIGSGSACRLGNGIFAVEPEIAIRMGGTVGAGDTPARARSQIASLAPALEIVDYGLAPLDLESIAASSSFHFGTVLGAARAGAEGPRIGVDCPLLLRNGARSGTPDPRLVPADLSDVVLFVARFLAAYGQALEAGDLVLSGACTSPIRIERGDTVRAEFDLLGSVDVRLAAA